MSTTLKSDVEMFEGRRLGPPRVGGVQGRARARDSRGRRTRSGPLPGCPRGTTTPAATAGAATLGSGSQGGGGDAGSWTGYGRGGERVAWGQ